MLKRKIETSVISWIKNDNKALLIDGARQVGKTFVIRKVFHDLNINYIEFNLIQSPQLIPLLAKSETIDDMITNLSLFTDRVFIKGKTFIFIDEIQEFKEIITKIKFWVDEGSFRFIFSGSLLGVALKNIASAPIGYLKTLTMYPMDFEEFLQLYHISDELKASLRKCFVNRKPVNEAVHSRMLQIFHTYLNVGGMPEAVQKFRETKNLEAVIDEHIGIVTQYKMDFTKYETESKRLSLTQIYDFIPTELNKANKRFIFADMKKGLRYENKAEDFLWLSNAGVALPVYNIVEPMIPLKINKSSSLFKFFLSDVGMLTTLYGKTCKLQLLSEQSDINFGAVYENAAAQELIAHGFTLYYYNSKRFGELDFVAEYHGKVLAIEIKSGKDYKRHSALNNIMNITNYSIDEAFIFTNYNVEVKGNTIYYPIYMLMFLDEADIDLPMIDIPDLSALTNAA